MYNQTISTLLNHRSIRKFKNQALSEEQIKLLVECAQAASTSSFTQSFSIIGVEDPLIKKQLREISGDQSYVEENGYFFVFVADQYRNQQIGEHSDTDTSVLDTTQRLIVALGDAAFAAQNMAVAAESMGLGICYIGSIQRDVKKTAELLQLPEFTFPVFGLAVGYPDQEPEKKPRLPFTAIFHKNVYRKGMSEDELKGYDQQIANYYHSRTGGNRDETWTGQIAQGLSAPARMALKPFLEKQHLGRR
ncbi:oxygen-insensitive NADPH nitroreductase [Sporolactobacillus laevolacticus]|uniref:oxygen-insensitive NADPH nitroreductase n=1 Tax=Sporolactobacillus laevolacticus TaxID=33018 RepID=UPI0025B4DB07|nr:oxygen-insensitive NADPH nitroreductase [Sporolactobacillus laevolacticus]MDN3955324.1 oxygen-insensitive NADPH nitroreductase [Sporolactobacillus laevolacticus]